MKKLVVMLAALGLVVAGCGGGGNSSSSKPLTKAQYRAQLQQLSNEVGAQLREKVGASTQLKKSDVPELQDSLRSFADKVEALSPPADVEDLHVRLVAAMRGLSDDLPSLVADLDKASDPSATIAALFGRKSIQNLLTLQQEYKDKGYDISSLLNSGAGP